MNTKTKIPVEAKKAAIQAALDGKDPYEPLAPYTSNPKSMWTYIKSVVKKKDPDLYARLPDLRDRKKIETPEGTLADAMEGMQEATDTFFGECEKMGLMKADEPEEPEEPKISKPLMHSGKTAIGWAGEFGDYYYDRKHGYIDYESKDGEELSMPVDAWREFLNEFREVAGLMGVAL